MICVACSGFHAMTELRCERLLLLVKLMTGFFSFKSHTTLRPLCEVDAMICVTLRFHATHEMSAPGPGDLVPGDTTRGLRGLVRSVMKTSESEAPDASSSGTAGLNSRPRTGPVCVSIVATIGSAPPAIMNAGLTTWMAPLTVPAARMPYGSEPSATPLVPHVRRLYRSAHVSVPSSGSSSLSDVRSSEKMSRCAVVSKVSEMAPATVPAASRPECSVDEDQATVAERGMLPIFGMAHERRSRDAGAAVRRPARSVTAAARNAAGGLGRQGGQAAVVSTSCCARIAADPLVSQSVLLGCCRS
eukprot:scaffold25575_cov118-Isochrysis_galbana.AAC.6